MPAGVILDTSFLITLANPKRTNHKTARRYWQHFAEQSIPMYLGVAHHQDERLSYSPFVAIV